MSPLHSMSPPLTHASFTHTLQAQDPLTNLWNGSFSSSKSVVFWYFRISLSATVPGLYLLARCGAGPGAPSFFPLSLRPPVDARPPRVGRAVFFRPGDFALAALGGIAEMVGGCECGCCERGASGARRVASLGSRRDYDCNDPMRVFATGMRRCYQ